MCPRFTLFFTACFLSRSRHPHRDPLGVASRSNAVARVRHARLHASTQPFGQSPGRDWRVPFQASGHVHAHTHTQSKSQSKSVADLHCSPRSEGDSVEEDTPPIQAQKRPRKEAWPLNEPALLYEHDGDAFGGLAKKIHRSGFAIATAERFNRFVRLGGDPVQFRVLYLETKAAKATQELVWHGLPPDTLPVQPRAGRAGRHSGGVPRRVSNGRRRLQRLQRAAPTGRLVRHDGDLAQPRGRGAELEL